MSDPNIQEKLARGKVKAFVSSFGKRAFHLACHAAIPVVLGADLLHLLRINFFLDPPEPLPYTVESDILLSPLCNEIGGNLYEIPPPIRDILLRELATTPVYGEQRIREIATLLLQYSKRFSPWKDNLTLERGQQLTALNFLDAHSAKRWLEAAEESFHLNAPSEREWFIAMRNELLKIDAVLREQTSIDPNTPDEISPLGFKLLTSIPAHEKPIGRIAWSRDGSKLASPSADTTIKLWDASTGQLIHTLSGHSSRVICASWSPMDHYLASGSDDQTARIWDTDSGKLIQTIKDGSSSVASLAWSPNGSTLALGLNDSTVLLWDNNDGVTQKLAGPTGRVTSLKWSPDGVRLAASSEGENRIYIWSIRNKRSRPRLLAHNANVLDIDWSPDGKMIAAGCSDCTIRLWSTRDNRSIRKLEGHTDIVNAVSFSSDGRLIASKSYDGTVRIWRADTGEFVSVIEKQGMHFIVAGLAFNPQKPILATLGAQDTTINVWQIDQDILLKPVYKTVDTLFTSAKIVLLGETGIGKTSLTKALSTTDSLTKFPENIHPSDLLAVHLPSNIRCETVLWDIDLPDPLLSSLYLFDADIVLLFFNNHSPKNSLNNMLTYWKELFLGRRRTYRTIWVEIDKGSNGLTAQEVESFFLKHGREYVLANISTAEGLDELIELLKQKISTSKLVSEVNIGDFNIVKDYVLMLKEERDQNVYFYNISEIRHSLNDQYKYRHFSSRTLRQSLRHLEKYGLIKLLRTSKKDQDIVWLDPAYVSQFMGVLFEVARKRADRRGVIQEQRLIKATYGHRGFKHLSVKANETLLDVALQLLIEHKICFRSMLYGEATLTFPALTHSNARSETVDYYSQSSLDKLLAWLSQDREDAGRKYENIRQSLIKIFSWRGIPDAEDAADATIDRVANKIDDIAPFYAGDPALYFYGVAKRVQMEYARRELPLPLPSFSDRSDELEVEHRCLEHCLQNLSKENRELILQYYSMDKQARIVSRKELAKQLDITLNNLYMRVHRIKLGLAECINDCLSRSDIID